jgi:hypothetical protein
VTEDAHLEAAYEDANGGAYDTAEEEDPDPCIVCGEALCTCDEQYDTWKDNR